MADDSLPKLPPLPPLPEDEAATLERRSTEPPKPPPAEARPAPPPPRRAAPRRPRPDEERRIGTAGHALVVCVLALVIGMVLNAPGTHKNAYNQPEGWQRDVALAVTGPLADVSHALLLDRPRAAVKSALGREDDDEIDVEIALPAQPAAPSPGTPPPPPGAAPPPPSSPTPASPGKPAFSPKRKLRLWVVGDSLVVTPGWSVVRAAGASPAIEAVGGVDGRVATGLTRPDVFNWFEEIRRRLKELKPRAVVVSFGGNDDKAYMTGLPDGVEIGDFGDAAWRKEYARRAGGLMDTANRAGAHVVWIGLPQTRSPEQTARFDVVNAVVLKEARKREGKVTFIDTYTLFASDTGGYADYLDRPGGGSLKVRAGDGVHFERAGGDMIAREVLKALNRAYDLTSWRKAR